jgi:hypothetical protein
MAIGTEKLYQVTNPDVDERGSRRNDLQEVNVDVKPYTNLFAQPTEPFFNWLEKITSRERGKSFFDWLN